VYNILISELCEVRLGWGSSGSKAPVVAACNGADDWCAWRSSRM